MKPNKTVLTLLKVPLSSIEPLKYVRQLRMVLMWLKAGAKGTIEAATGFGKSVLALLVIIKMQKKNPNYTTIIIVPTRP